MSGPFVGERAAQPLDLLEQGAAGNGWEGLENLLHPVLGKSPLMPEDSVARFMWGLYCTAEGRAMFEWLMDLTIRRPLNLTAPTFEQTAMLAYGRQAVNGVAEVILKAIAEGEASVAKTKPQPQNGDGS
ncbi:hypothetical protein [Rhizobium tumorigenes]|uniref:hypothetical protein n=1 Tax=Rhizobium tumorigenes TaxID=2041385 RepID=UPI00241C59E6|nr:hypothetical protein [Rhizobium tumorigenes]WFS02209.1 hypothetical protein PR016_06240 [Rhizobium tumorigenes]